MAARLARAVPALVALAVKAALAQVPAQTDQMAELDVAGPGGLVVLEEVTVRADRIVDVQQAATEVVSLLTAEDISRTGEGDIAGALSFVPGLSVVGGGFVFVRGLGDRYSLALLNGSPLPSPEPLRRAVPLDLFPTGVVASSLVQKTYSPNYPGEFGGGVINLTTLAIPVMPFLKLGVGASANTQTTGQRGYHYYGSGADWTGFDRGARSTPPALAEFFASGQRMSALDAAGSGHIASELVGWRNAVVQGDGGMPGNWSASASGGTSWGVGSGNLGLIATAGYSNGWRTRDNLEQTSASLDLSSLDRNYRQVSSENRIVTHALAGLGYEQGDSQLRWTSLYIHDTVKRASLAEGEQRNQRTGWDFIEQGTGWYERQLLGTQLAGTLALEPVTLNGRASWSRSRRDAPYEFSIGYSRSNVAGQPFGQSFINRLDNGQTGFAGIAFSNLDEDVVSSGLDAAWRVADGVVLSAGYDYAWTARDSQRREFQIVAPAEFPTEVGLLRPDLLLSPAVIGQWKLRLIETTEQFPAFAARMRVHGAFGQVQARLGDALELAAGARFERGKQVVRSIPVFSTPNGSGNAHTRVEEDYVLPAATLTWKLGAAQDRQLRLHASKTIARPQFRELMFQSYYDPDSNRTYRGNPLLGDSAFLNGEARFEWYMGGGQRVSLAGFYKRIDRPIEAFTAFNENTPVTSFANAPEADLHGAEVEVQKHVDLYGLAGSGWLGDFIAQRRLVLVGNYTFTGSRINVGEGDRVAVYGTQVQPASNYFRDGSRLTGQSRHLANLQLGLERPDNLSQVTLLLSYAGDRVTSRGAAGLPDILESPGLKADLVLRQGLVVAGTPLEVKFEARNLLGRDYAEFQHRGSNRVYFNRYAVGTTLGLSVTMDF
jgi:hypothetical protein